MINVSKIEIEVSKELLSKIKWCSDYAKATPNIINGSLRVVKYTNLAYVEPHRVILKNCLYLFFNEHEFFYVGDLRNKHPLKEMQNVMTASDCRNHVHSPRHN